jgi:hypothetical protein
MARGDAHQRQHGHEVPVPGPGVAAQQVRQRRQAHGLPDGDSGDHDDRRQPRHGEVGELLQRVVLALARMLPLQEQVEADHVPGAAGVAAARRQVSPFPVQIEEPQVEQPVQHQDPHGEEVPVAGTAQPSAEGDPVREPGALPGPAAEGLAATGEAWIGVEDAQPGADHHGEREGVHPVGEPDDPVVAFHRGRGSHGGSGAGHRSCSFLVVGPCSTHGESGGNHQRLTTNDHEPITHDSPSWPPRPRSRAQRRAGTHPSG